MVILLHAWISEHGAYKIFFESFKISQRRDDKSKIIIFELNEIMCCILLNVISLNALWTLFVPLTSLLMDYARKIALYHNGPQHRTKLKLIDRFGDKNRVISSNFNATILKFLRKFTIYFRICLYLVICFLRVTVSLLCRIQEMFQFIPIYIISVWRRNCSTLWPTQQRNRDSLETCYQI